MRADLPNMAGHPVGDKAARQRFLSRSMWLTIPGTYLALAIAYVVVPPIQGLEGHASRLVLAVRWLPIAMIPYAAVCLLILAARFFEGSHDPLAGTESERLTIHCRVMQNTLEQLLWFSVCLVPLSTYLAPQQARIVPILCSFFAVARFVYWWGYLRSGTLGRAAGVQLTFAVNIPLFASVLVLLAVDLLE